MVYVGRWLMGGWLGMIVGVSAGLFAAGFHMAYYLLAGGAINGSATLASSVGQTAATR
jgi:hypothetical protein